MIKEIENIFTDPCKAETVRAIGGGERYKIMFIYKEHEEVGETYYKSQEDARKRIREILSKAKKE